MFLALASGILNNLAENQQAVSDKNYEKKLTAWEKERERIMEVNRQKAERAQRRNAMASAIKSNIGYMPPKMVAVPGMSTAPEKPDVDNTYGNLASALSLGSGLASQYGGTEGIYDRLRNESSIGKILQGGGGSQEAPVNDTLASVTSPSSGYTFSNRYNPKRYLS